MRSLPTILLYSVLFVLCSPKFSFAFVSEKFRSRRVALYKDSTLRQSTISQPTIIFEGGMLSTERSYNKQQEQQKQSFTSGAVPRAMRLFDIVWNEIAKPAYTALIQRGLPTEDWNVFWSSPVSGMGSMTLATQSTLALEKMGPTYVKFGQALASRPDVVPRALAQALSTLQDSMQPFDTKVAKAIIQRELESSFANDQDLEVFVSSLSEVPVAAASIGQVYSGRLPNGQKVAIKVQRPGIREIVNQDSSLLRTIVELIESIPAISGIQTDQKRFIETDLSGAVEEFMSRVIEELDYRNEARNLQLFFELYSHRRELTQEEKKNENRIEIVVPEVYMNLCTDSVLVMEWIEGTHLVDLETENSTNESLDLIDMAIQCTFSQLLDTGVMHADPHGGNLLKVLDKKQGKEPILRLGYVDFGLLSTVPVGVRDGLVCAVAELVFSKNVTAVANLFGELDLIPEEILSDHSERIALSKELNTALNSCLVYDGPPGGSATDIPALRFDKLLDALTRLVPRFKFQLPPYFINNARALGTLEGIAREINPSFNVLQALYPYVLGRLLSNPTNSPVVESTLQSLIRSPFTGHVDSQRVQKLLDDSTLLTGFSKKKVLVDIFRSRSGPRLARIFVKEQLRNIFRGRFSKMASYLRL